MRMKFYALFLLACVLGCQGIPASPEISPEMETLEEAGFRVRYPKDWNITSESQAPEAHQKIDRYVFRHPRNKECYVTVEIFSFAKEESAESSNEIISHITRSYKNIFKQSGWLPFTFKTKETRLNNKPATELLMHGQKGNAERAVSAIIIPAKNSFYVVTRQWFDHWDRSAQERLQVITNSFQVL